MPCDFHCEAIAKFLIPDRPQEDNYPDHDEFEEKEKEWEEKRDLALVQHTAWVEREQVAEATRAAAEKQKLRREVVEHKQKTAARKKVGSIVDVLTSGSPICSRCSLKGPSNLLLICDWLMMVLRDRLCEEGWWLVQSRL